MSEMGFNDPRIVLQLRSEMRSEGRPLRATPSDLERFGLEPWSGSWFGIVCVESALVKA